MDTEMTDKEYLGLDKLLIKVGADVKYDLFGNPDEMIFTTPQLVMFIDLMLNLIVDNPELFTQPTEDDVQ
jgi:hypothetical protein